MKSLWRALAILSCAGMLIFASQTRVQAQIPGVPSELCDDAAYAAANEEECTYNVGGAGVTPQDIQAAIDAPTPNLANTTAYIFYTLTVVMRGTVSVPGPGGANAAAMAPATSLTQATEQYGAIGGIGFLMGEMIRNQPASTQTYIAYVVGNSRLMGDQAYAQGIGFGALNPILGTWVAFRDMAYYLLIIMFFISGFLILIRHKISGQVAVTVQTVLPRLVLTLILITFSYAIAGFIIDAMFLSIYFVINLFDGAIFKNDATFALFYNTDPKTLTDIALNTHIFEFMLGYIFNSNPSGSAWGAADALGTMVQETIAAIVGDSALFGFFSDGGLFKGLITIVFTLIFGIALLIAMFRTFFALLMSYAGFIINVVLSPFILLPGVMPNNNAFADWVKNLIAGLAPFVVAIFMIFMSLALTGGPDTNNPGVGYRPNSDTGGVDGLRLPLIMAGGIKPSAFLGVVSMGFMLLMPEAVGIAKKLVGAKGGMFDEYKDKAVNAFKQGYTGGQMVPGLGFTKVPGAQRMLFGDEKSKALAKDPTKMGYGRNRFGVIGATGSYAKTVGSDIWTRAQASGTSKPTGRTQSTATPITQTGLPTVGTPPPGRGTPPPAPHTPLPLSPGGGPTPAAPTLPTGLKPGPSGIIIASANSPVPPRTPTPPFKRP